MRKSILLSLIVLLSAVWLSAQYSNQTNSSGQSTGAGSTMENQATAVTGCLSESGGNYMLTDKSGNTYQLTGETAALSHHVGHEMRIMGTLTPTSGSSATATGTSNGMGQTGAQTLNVKSFKHISASCTNAQ